MWRSVATRFRRRRAVSTIIGGMIILSLLLTALGTMVFVTQQYDAYQNTVNKVSQYDIAKFSENLQFVNPGMGQDGTVASSACASSKCDVWNLILNNLAGVGTQIVTIYIVNATDATGLLPSGGCSKLCVLGPYSPKSNPASPSTFSSPNSFINPAESNHNITLWFSSGSTFDPLSATGAYSISIVTSRGRAFSLTWPMPQQPSAPQVLSYNTGPFLIRFDPMLYTYTDVVQPTPLTPITNGWSIPEKIPLIWFFRISNLQGSPITLLDSSVLLAGEFAANLGSGSGNGYTYGGGLSAKFATFFLINPMSQTYFNTYFQNEQGYGTAYYDPTWNSFPSNTYPKGDGTGISLYNTSLAPYSSCGTAMACYTLPAGSSQGKPGADEYLLFSAGTFCGAEIVYGAGAACNTSFTPDGRVYPLRANGLDDEDLFIFFLSLHYILNGYQYGITISIIGAPTQDNDCTWNGQPCP